jgi:hypothetical protein
MPVEKAAWGSFVADGADFSDFMFSLTREEIMRKSQTLVLPRR